jgi:hypothetical protein
MVTIVDPHIKRDPAWRTFKEAEEKGLYVKNKDGADFDGWVECVLGGVGWGWAPCAVDWLGSRNLCLPARPLACLLSLCLTCPLSLAAHPACMCAGGAGPAPAPTST